MCSQFARESRNPQRPKTMSQRLFSQLSQDATSSKRIKTAPKVFKKKPVSKMSRSDLEAAVSKIINRKRETKFKTYVENEIQVNSLSGIYVRNYPQDLALGPANNERNGNKINPVGIGIRCACHNNASTAMWLRILVLEVFDGHSTTAEIIGNLFEGTAGQDVTTDGLTPILIRKVNREQFRVLRDEVLSFPGGSEQPGKAQVFKHYSKLGGTMTYHDEDQAFPDKRHVVCWQALEADGDESLGSVVETSVALDFYYKDM